MAVNFPIRRAVDGIARRIWPPSCLACGLPGDPAADRDLCAACHAALPRQPNACRTCALPLPPGEIAVRCSACLRRGDAPLTRVHAAFAYAAPLDRLLPRFKFSQSLACGRLASNLMADALRRQAPDRPDALVPIPLHRERLRTRGYDQALELARPLARRLALPILSGWLQRRHATQAQSRLDKAGRHANLRDAFEVRGHRPLPAHVALIDDVMTTGATLEAAARCLRAAGVQRVDAWVCARVA